ncbi:hypothetical protein C5L39_10295 [Corynebacterium alimapuense]|uniref:Uncharacterized protein n=1 Tax=Corynebacterium alimapuense TaxID=1576874 RepID=A0A3M8K6V5_9CORY|nr:hypothetical protein C5L39_10295 [Corynebacterium alimapuense]
MLEVLDVRDAAMSGLPRRLIPACGSALTGELLLKKLRTSAEDTRWTVGSAEGRGHKVDYLGIRGGRAGRFGSRGRNWSPDMASQRPPNKGSGNKKQSLSVQVVGP